MSKTRLLLFFAICFVVTFYSISATNLFVDSEIGVDGPSNSCTGRENPCATLSQAILQSSPNDEIIILNKKIVVNEPILLKHSIDLSSEDETDWPIIVSSVCQQPLFQIIRGGYTFSFKRLRFQNSVYDTCIPMTLDTLLNLNNNSYVISNQFTHKSEWKNMTILGTSVSIQNVTFEHMSAVQCLGCSVEIEGAYFYKSPGATLLLGASSLKIQHSVFDQFYEPANVTMKRTGLIAMTSASSVLFDNCHVKNMRLENEFQRYFIRISGKHIFITNSQFVNNSMSSHFLTVESAVTLSNTHFINNSMKGLGILLRTKDDVAILFSSFVNNTAILGSIVYYSSRENTNSEALRVQLDKHNFEFFGNVVKGNRVQASPVGVVSIYASRRSDFVNNIFINNEAQFGGALNIQESKEIQIRGCTFAYNKAILGGAIFLKNVILKFDNGNGFNIGASILNSQCVNNVAQSNGGCLYSTAASMVAFETSLIANNSALTGTGGALHVKSSTSMVKYVEPGYASNFNLIHFSSFINNRSYRGGGALTIRSNHLSYQITDTLFEKSSVASTYGGAIYAQGMVKLLIRGSTMKDSFAFRGGCIYFEGLRFSSQQSSFHRCTAKIAGGALFLQDIFPKQDPTNNPAIFIDNNLFLDSYADRSGGALFVDSPLVSLGRITFSNCSSMYGGAVFTKQPIMELGNLTMYEVNGQFGMIATVGESVGKLNRALRVRNTAQRNDTNAVVYYITPFKTGTSNANQKQIRNQKLAAEVINLVQRDQIKVASSQKFNLVQLAPSYNTISQSAIRASANSPQTINVTFYNGLDQPIVPLEGVLQVIARWKGYMADCFDVNKRDKNCLVRVRGIPPSMNITSNNPSNTAIPLSFTLEGINSKLPANSTLTMELVFLYKDYLSYQSQPAFSKEVKLTVDSCSYPSIWQAEGTIPRSDPLDSNYWYCSKSRCPVMNFDALIAFSTLTLVAFVLSWIIYNVSLFVSAVALIRQRLQAQVYHFWNRFVTLLMELSINILLIAAVALFFIREVFFDTPTPADAYKFLSWMEHIGHVILCIAILLSVTSMSLVMSLLYQLSNQWMPTNSKNKVCKVISILGFSLSHIMIVVTSIIAVTLYLVFYFKDIYSENRVEFYSYNVSIYLVMTGGLFLLLLCLYLIHLLVFIIPICRQCKQLKPSLVTSYIIVPIYLWCCYLLTGLALTFFDIVPSCKIQFLYMALTLTCLGKCLMGIAICNLPKVPIKMKALDTDDSDMSSSLLSMHHDKHQTIENVIQLEKLLPSNYIIPANEIQMLQQIGTGAQGSVYKAEFNSTEVAIKCFPTKAFGNATDLKDFFTEASALLQYANHTNILRFIGVVNHEQQQYVGIVTEFCPMGSLANVLDKQAKDYSLQEKCKWLLGIASGMVHLHKIPIIHRDLKCENVLLDNAMTCKIADFGFAKYLTKESNPNMTLNVGTAAFTAPEVFKSAETSKAKYDERCDVYSFGIIIYCVLVNSSKPYGRISDMDIILKVSKNISGDANAFRPSLDNQFIQETIEKGNRWIIDLMNRCWSNNVDLRPSFVEIVSTLKAKLN